MTTNLVLISGKGFSTEEDSYIDNFALSLCSTSSMRKNVVFIPTASHDSVSYIEKFNNAFREHDTSHLTVDKLMSNTFLDQADLIYIGGGDSHYLMEAWRKVGFNKKIVDLYKNGTVIAGLSAGAMCWFEYVFEENRVSEGLSILAGSLCPHYDEQNEEKQSYDAWSEKNPDIRHFKLNNNESLHVKHNQIVAKIVTY